MRRADALETVLDAFSPGAIQCIPIPCYVTYFFFSGLLFGIESRRGETGKNMTN